MKHYHSASVTVQAVSIAVQTQVYLLIASALLLLRILYSSFLPYYSTFQPFAF